MKEMTVLDLANVDLASLAQALEDQSGDTSWWLDPKTGEVEPRSEFLDGEEEEDEIEARELVRIQPVPSHQSYGDMEDFIGLVEDRRARDLLERAIAGRGAFRRFKDTLFEFPELREAWFRFHDVRLERRAIEWLRDEGLVEPAAAGQALSGRPDPQLPSAAPTGFDADAIARRVAAELRALYGDRLRQVILFGSWARGDAHPESDIDLLVVLTDMESLWEELRRMAPILGRHSVENDTVVSASPVTELEYRQARTPMLIRVHAEGRQVA